MKRIGIFSFFDIAGIVDDYVIYYLKEMSKVLEDIYFVSNGKLSQESKVKVEPYIRHIIERENKGFDAGAYKDVISAFESEIWDDADELVLFNDTVFGPFYKICERVYRLGGRSCIDFKMLFPGYVQINDTTRDEITEAQEFIDCLWKMTGRSFRRLIIRQLDDDDNRFLEQILDDNVMRISMLEMTDDEQVKSIVGLLSACWRDINEFDYKNRTAIVTKQLFGRVLRIPFGIWTFDDPKIVWIEEKLTAGDKYIMPEGVFRDDLGA